MVYELLSQSRKLQKRRLQMVYELLSQSRKLQKRRFQKALIRTVSPNKSKGLENVLKKFKRGDAYQGPESNFDLYVFVLVITEMQLQKY